MFKFLTINKILIFASILTLILVSATSAFGQESDETLNKYNIKFPIAELGSCKSVSDCRTYCEDPVNYQTCVDYAKNKGFYDENKVDAKKEEVIKKAQTELGCDSYESCKTYCQIPTNFNKCDSFARKNRIAGGHVEDPGKKEIIEKAKTVLGCDNVSTCAAYCSDEANRQKCSDFAKEAGLRGGERPVGPGGCTSEETCKAFCSDPDNFKICQGFVVSAGSRFSGPGGCNSEESCKNYCTQNPQACRSERSYEGKYDQEQMCQKTPNCSWKDNSCVCGAYNTDEARKTTDEAVKYCREKPERCTPGGIGGFDRSGERAQFEKFCRENPEKCRPSYSNYSGGMPYDPAIECSKHDGCLWTSGSCQCGTRYAQTEADREKSCTTGGCRWAGNGCDCSGSSADSPSLACGRRQGCSWINSSCQCSSYNQNYYNYGSSYGSSMSREQQESTCKAGGGTCNWQNDICSCQNYRAPTNQYYNSSTGSYTTVSTPTPTTSSTGSYTGSSTGTSGAYSGNTMSRDQQESTCRAGGGTCDWSSGMCNCRGYTSPTNTTSTTGTTTSTTTNSTGMSREQQESGCRSCNGTCNWNGDTCQCQCNSSGSSGSTTQTTQPTSAPQPEQQTQSAPDPATACSQTSGCSWNGSSCQCGGVQGTQTKSWWRYLLDLF